jgi:hypothetical protein
LLVQARGVQSHEGQEGLSLDGVKGAGNGLESGRDGGASAHVVWDNRFDELTE